MGGTLVLPDKSKNLSLSSGGGQLPGINQVEYVPPTRPTIPEWNTAHPGIPVDDQGIPVPQNV